MNPWWPQAELHPESKFKIELPPKPVFKPRQKQRAPLDWLTLSGQAILFSILAGLMSAAGLSGCAGRDYGTPSGTVRHADKPPIWCNDTRQGTKLYHVPPAPCPDLSDVGDSIQAAFWESNAKKKDLEGLSLVFVDHRIICGPLNKHGKVAGVTRDEAGNLHQFWTDIRGNLHDGYTGCYHGASRIGHIQVGGLYRDRMEYSIRHETCHHIEPNLEHWEGRCFIWTLLGDR